MYVRLDPLVIEFGDAPPCWIKRKGIIRFRTKGGLDQKVV